jgi:hypothetical protein
MEDPKVKVVYTCIVLKNAKLDTNYYGQTFAMGAAD